MLLGIQKFKAFISLVIGFFLLIGNFNVQAWSSYTSNAGDGNEFITHTAISQYDKLPIFPPVFPINSESESDEEVGEEESDGSDSELVKHFLPYLYPRTLIGGNIEANHRSALVDLPYYMLFHCWKSYCLSIF